MSPLSQDFDVKIINDNCINLWSPGIDLYPERSCFDVSNLGTALDLRNERSFLSDQMNDFETLYACLQRIEQQMTVAMLSCWLDQNPSSQNKQLLEDFKAFIQSEEAAVF